MNREDKIKLLIERGFVGDVNSGKVYNRYGKEVLTVNSQGYLQMGTKYNGKVFNIKQHQFIWFLAHGEIVEYLDHIDREKTNNKISNLRSVTNQQNGFNRDPKGYCWCNRNKKWKAYIKVNNINIHLGYFDLDQEHLARQAYVDAKLLYHKL